MVTREHTNDATSELLSTCLHVLGWILLLIALAIQTQLVGWPIRIIFPDAIFLMFAVGAAALGIGLILSYR